MSGHDELLQIARQTVLEADESGGRLSASRLADQMIMLIDPDHICPPLPTYAARATCVQMLGRALREQWGDQQNPVGEKFTDQLEFKEFTNCLQARYPVSIGSELGETEYKLIDELTAREKDVLVNRMRRIGDKYHRHADQLDRYFRARIAKLV